MASPPFALLGSGEFEAWTDPVDSWLLDRATGDGRVLVFPTASSPEGPDVFDRWARMGLDHYQRAGRRAEVVPLKDRSGASDAEVVSMIRGASVVFFSGGNPAYLAATLEDTPVWNAVLEELDRGMAYAGCSAGVASLGEAAPDSSKRDPTNEAGGIMRAGLALFPQTYFMPHWDALNTYIPGLRELLRAAVPAGSRMVTIDERTAMLGDGAEWTVLGAATVGVVQDGDERSFAPGESFVEDLREATAPRE